MAATLRMASLTKVRLDSQGYTSWGRYFGNVPGTHIYMLDCDKPSIDHAMSGDTRWFFRAWSRHDALEQSVRHLGETERLRGVGHFEYIRHRSVPFYIPRRGQGR
jgi:hypothetical protein